LDGGRQRPAVTGQPQRPLELSHRPFIGPIGSRT
jgi:hypothetical protein